MSSPLRITGLCLFAAAGVGMAICLAIAEPRFGKTVAQPEAAVSPRATHPATARSAPTQSDSAPARSDSVAAATNSAAAHSHAAAAHSRSATAHADAPTAPIDPVTASADSVIAPPDRMIAHSNSAAPRIGSAAAKSQSALGGSATCGSGPAPPAIAVESRQPIASPSPSIGMHSPPADDCRVAAPLPPSPPDVLGPSLGLAEEPQPAIEQQVPLPNSPQARQKVRDGLDELRAMLQANDHAAANQETIPKPPAAGSGARRREG